MPLLNIRNFLRLKAIFRRGRIEADLSEELRYHLDKETEKKIAGGLTPEEARYAALRGFGGVEQIKEECRDVSVARWIETLRRDLSYGYRTLLKSPGFITTATLILGLGVAANTVVFSVLHALLIRPLPFKEPHRIAVVCEIDPEGQTRSVSALNFMNWQTRSQVLEPVAAFRGMDTILTGPGYADQLMGARVSEELLPLLGVGPLLGRIFVESDFRANAEPVAVISHLLWQRRFGSAREILGQTLTLDGQKFTIVGVMPRQFWFWTAGDSTDVWIPLRFKPDELTQTAMRRFEVFGRLKPGKSLEEAQAEMDLKISPVAQEYPKLYSGRGVKVLWLRDWHQQYQPSLLGMLNALPLLLAAVGFVLLIACANVANLVLARALGRQGEFAIRSALGASRWDLIRQLLVESLMLAASAAVFGLLLAHWGIKASTFLLPDEIRWILPGGKETISINLPVLSFTLVISLLTGLILGLVPALKTCRVDLDETLKKGGGGPRVSLSSRRVQNPLVVSQIAISSVLLIGACLMMSSFLRLLRVNSGFNPARLVVMLLLSHRNASGHPAFYNQVLERVRALAGIDAASLMTNIPVAELWQENDRFTLEGETATRPGEGPRVITTLIDADFFRTMQIPLLRGRAFTEHDTNNSQGVAIISQSLVRRYFPNSDPIGRRIRADGLHSKDPWLSIVGVVGDIQHKLSPEAAPTLYGFYLQQDPIRAVYLFVRSPLAPENVVASIRKEVWSIDRNQPITYFWTMDYLITSSIFITRYLTWLLGTYAALALIFSVMGIYGVISYSICQRTHEIGIRVALGAQQSDVLRLFVGKALLLALIGVGIGLFGALGLTRLLVSQLCGVSATNPGIFATVSLVLTGVTLLASYIPARRAARVDPMVALRHE